MKIQIIKNIPQEHKQKAIECLNKILLYFNYNLKKEIMNSLFKSNDTNNNNKCLLGIIKKYSYLFGGFTLSKKKLNKMIKSSNNLNEIKEILPYSKNCLEFFDILDENKDFLLGKKD